MRGHSNNCCFAQIVAKCNRYIEKRIETLSQKKVCFIYVRFRNHRVDKPLLAKAASEENFHIIVYDRKIEQSMNFSVT